MKMFKYSTLLLLSFTVLLNSCKESTSKSSNVTINGFIIENPPEVVYLSKYIDSLNNYTIVDSAILGTNIEDRKFTFNTHVDSMEFLLITHKGLDKVVELIASKNEIIKVEYTPEVLPKTALVSGSSNSSINMELYAFVDKYVRLKAVVSERLDVLNYEDTAARMELIRRFESERAILQTEKARLFSMYKTSPAVHVFLPYINPETELLYFQQIEQTFSTNLKNTVWHKSVLQKLNDVENYLRQKSKQQEKADAIKRLSPGGSAPEISLPDPDGNTKHLSDLKGKVVLIDFWASWCKPCRAENPNVVRLYNKYKSKGFDIFSVSLDKNVNKWKSAIIKDNLTWDNHVSDLLGWNTSVTSLYNFSGIPHTVLIDREGNIIASKLRGPALEAKLKELFD